jgi:hypothetical protein
MNSPDTDDLINVLKHLFPGLWEMSYPRRYDNLGNFYSPKIAALGCADAAAKAIHSGLHDHAIRNEFMVSAQCAKHGFPTFFVSSAMLKACSLTNLPPDLNWTDIPLPFPGMTFIFERGAIVHPEDKLDVPYLSLARTRKGDRLSHPYPGTPSGNMGVGGMAMMTTQISPTKIFHMDFTMSEQTSPFIRDIDLAAVKEYEVVNADHLMSISAEGKESNKWLMLLGLKLILVMNARPEQVSMGTFLRSVKPKRPGEPKVEYWSPNVLGRTYQARTEDDNTAAPGEQGHKRMHWRRGHFRQQPHGPNMALRKTIWLEPMLVGELKTA